MTTIMALLNQVSDDEVVLPAIQRDFVWSEAQTVKLLDSVMRRYPVGIILLWETYNDIQFRDFVKDYRSGSIPSFRDNTANRRIRLVLDGQQRLQSLYLALFGQRDGRPLFLDVLSGQEYDDLREERFLFAFKSAAEVAETNAQTEQEAAPSEERDNETPYWWIAVRDLFRMGVREKRDLVRDITNRLQLSEEESILLDQNLSAFDDAFTRDENILKLSTVDANLPNDSPYRKSEADVLEIFVRINREGTALSRSDLIFSMLKLNWRESAEGLPEFVDSINEGNSFALDTDFVVRCLFAVSGLGGKLDIDLLRNRRHVVAMQSKFAECCDAIRATVDFVHSECRCDSSSLLGSASTLVPIVYYLCYTPGHLVPNDQVDRLRTAIYVLGLARPFSRYSESRIGAFVRRELEPRVNAGDNTMPLEAVLSSVRLWERIDSLDGLAEANVDLTLHLVQGLSGAKVQYSRNAPEVDHIFPRAELRRRNVDEDLIQDFANFWILAQGKNRNKSNRDPRRYFEDVSDRQLRAALIDRGLLNYRGYKRFLRTRRAEMIMRVGKKIGIGNAELAAP